MAADMVGAPGARTGTPVDGWTAARARCRRYVRLAGVSALRGAASTVGAAMVSGVLWWLSHR